MSELEFTNEEFEEEVVADEAVEDVAPKKVSKVFSILSLVASLLGFTGFVGFPFLFDILGLVFAIVHKKKAGKHNGMSKAGLIISIISLAWAAVQKVLSLLIAPVILVVGILGIVIIKLLPMILMNVL